VNEEALANWGAIMPNKKKLTSNAGTLTEENKVMWINHKKCIPLFIALLP
jgi:hypothetical protein